MIIEQLIKDIQKGSTEAQAQIYELLGPKIFAICLKYSKNYEEAQDNFQEGFLLVFEKIEKYNFKGSFEGWAKRVVINYILQQYRNTKIFEVIHENIQEEENVYIDEEVISLDFLTKIIQELPDRYRLVFNLYVLDGYSHKEIAELLQISEGTSKSNLARGKSILKKKIEDFEANLDLKAK